MIITENALILGSKTREVRENGKALKADKKLVKAEVSEIERIIEIADMTSRKWSRSWKAGVGRIQR